MTRELIDNWSLYTETDLGYASPCWLWRGFVKYPEGYGQLTRPLHDTRIAHIGFYREFIGEIPEGYEIDHLCHGADPSCPGNACVHRKCVNPDHLEAVTHAVNVQRGRASFTLRSKCKAGLHDVSDTTGWTTNGVTPSGKPHRICAECTRARYHAKYRRSLGVAADAVAA